jgi:hypothetical protein
LSRRKTEYVTRLQFSSALPWGHEKSQKKTSKNKGVGRVQEIYGFNARTNLGGMSRGNPEMIMWGGQLLIMYI